MTTDTINVRHNFEDSEMAELAREQSRHLNKQSELEQSLKAISAQYKADIEGEKAKIGGCSHRISQGWEMRDVPALLIRERPAGYGMTIRLDSGAIWKRRKLEEPERQMILTTEPPKPFFAVCILRVDDADWKNVEAFPMPVFEDEFDKLKGLPGVLEWRAWEDHSMIEGE